VARSEILKLDGFYFWCILKGNDCENRKNNFLGGEGVWHLAACSSFVGVCVLLLDEVDSLCPRKGVGGLTPHQVRVSAQLLMLLDRADQVKGLVVIATTNRPNALDPAVRRPGRLETEVTHVQ
jgi:AAA+ superfamily predicted ATPase